MYRVYYMLLKYRQKLLKRKWVFLNISQRHVKYFLSGTVGVNFRRVLLKGPIRLTLAPKLNNKNPNWSLGTLHKQLTNKFPDGEPLEPDQRSSCMYYWCVVTVIQNVGWKYDDSPLLITLTHVWHRNTHLHTCYLLLSKLLFPITITHPNPLLV